MENFTKVLGHSCIFWAIENVDNSECRPHLLRVRYEDCKLPGQSVLRLSLPEIVDRWDIPAFKAITKSKAAESLTVSRRFPGQNKSAGGMAPAIKLELHKLSNAMVYIVLIWVKCVRCTVAINHEGRGLLPRTCPWNKLFDKRARLEFDEGH